MQKLTKRNRPASNQKVNWIDEDGKKKTGIYVKKVEMFFEGDGNDSSKFDFANHVKTWEPTK